MTPDESNGDARKGGCWIVAALLVALTLRLAGLSHDFAEGYQYHPDTPKQVRAVERFLHGKYWMDSGVLDYDAYPLFHSHLVEYLIRGYVTGGNVVAGWMGLPDQVIAPPVLDMYWIMRLFNVALSTWLVWILFRMGQEHFSRRAAFFAAWLLALSPADIVAAHFEAGDTAAGFFATVSVFFALRIFERGRKRDYLWAVVFGIAAFASKYHAGMALLAAGLAHVLHFPGKKLWSRAALQRSLLTIAVAVAALPLAIPTIFTHGWEVGERIFAFLTQVSGGERLPEEIRAGGFFSRFSFSMERNVPVLLRILSPVVAVLSIVGLVRIVRDRKLAILYVVPIVYFLVGVSLRPLSHPVYHTLMTPMLFLIAGVLLAPRRDDRGLLWPVLKLGVWSCAVLYLAGIVRGEVFFFQMPDMRRTAKEWTTDNVPDSFVMLPSAYSFDWNDRVDTNRTFGGALHVHNSIRGRRAPAGFVPLKSFRVEDESLPFFRNPRLDISLGDSFWIRKYFHLPVFLPVAAQHENPWIMNDGTAFWRWEKLFALKPEDRLSRWLVSEHPVTNLLVAAHAGPTPSRVRIECGGAAKTIMLAPRETVIETFAYMKSRKYPHATPSIVKIKVDADFGAAQVWIATEPLEKGLLLYQHGRFDESIVHLAEAFRAAPGSPTLAAMLMIASRAAGRTLPPDIQAALAPLAERVQTSAFEESTMAAYGLHNDYLDALPYLSWEAEDGKWEGYLRKARPSASGGWIVESKSNREGRFRSPPMNLFAGHYIFTFTGEFPGEGGLNFRLLDGERQLEFGYMNFGGIAETNRELNIDVRHDVVGARMELSHEVGTVIRLDRAEVRPDIRSNMETLATHYRTTMDARPPDPFHPGGFHLAMALGNVAAKEGRAGDAWEAYKTARLVCSDRVEPVQRSRQLPDGIVDPDTKALPHDAPSLIVASAQLANGASITGFQTDTKAVKRGASFGLLLGWDLSLADEHTRDYILWVHLKDEATGHMFTGDREWQLDFDRALDPASLTQSALPQIYVPADAPPGNYTIEVGLYRPPDQKIKVKSTDLPHTRHGVTLPIKIHVE